ncbi:endonuclease domain-containing protein [Saccharicrinis sp. FJH62]|uniref:endonuclease domain-containing protein n=1 Tax=Saccharicrinis sp. FJH62 TaxID=3344657 RepID=UPI0035D4B440
MKLNYNQHNKDFARESRKLGTMGEAILWRDLLKAKQLNGYQFNRQYKIGNYIVDFICRKLNLIIEVDGSSHKTNGPEDYDREKWLTELGYTVLRFSENEVIYNLNYVAMDIQNMVEKLEEEPDV